MPTSSEEERVECPVCTFSSDSESDMQRHIDRLHNNVIK